MSKALFFSIIRKESLFVHSLFNYHIMFVVFCIMLGLLRFNNRWFTRSDVMFIMEREQFR